MKDRYRTTWSKRYAVLKRDGRMLVIDTTRVRLMNLRRRIFAWAKVVAVLATLKGSRMAMYRLSYDTAGTLVTASEWAAGDISRFMERLQGRMGRRLLAYAWVAELQVRGVIHYHVCIVFSGRAPMPDRGYHSKDARGHWRSFKRMWDKGSSHTDFDVRSPFYMASYCKKTYQKAYEFFPCGAHAWAVWISDAGLKASLRYESLEDFKKGILVEIMDGEGVGFREGLERMEWEVQRMALVAHEGVPWKYCGSVFHGDGLKQWGVIGVTDADLQKRMYTMVDAPPGVAVAAEASA